MTTLLLTWKINWHEGLDLGLEGKTFDREEDFLAALGRISAQAKPEDRSYYKTHVSLFVGDREVWNERLDLNYQDRGNPRKTWKQCADFYRSNKGKDYATMLVMDADKRAEYYENLLAGNWNGALGYLDA